MMTGFLFAKWAYACIRMDMKPQNTGQNTDVQKQTANKAVSANIPVLLPNMAERYIFSPMTIPDCSTYRQETAKHGKRNTMEELPWSVPTSARKRTIN